VSVFLIFEAWVKQNKSPAQITAGMPQQKAVEQFTPVPSTPTASPAATPVGSAPTAVVAQKGQRVVVHTDLLVAEIDTVGGDLRRVELLKHRDPIDKSKNFVLMHDGPAGVYVAQSGFLGEGHANHTTVYSASNTQYDLKEGSAELEVVLTATLPTGTISTKTYRFSRGSYLIGVEFQANMGAGAVPPRHAYFQLVRDDRPAPGDSKMMPTYTGGEVFTEATKLIKLTYEDVKDSKVVVPKYATEGWIAFVQHYFLGAWLPEKGTSREYYARALDHGLYAFGAIVPLTQSGPALTVKVPLYVGPQEQDTLKNLAPGLEFTVDYGWLRLLAVPLFWVLNEIHDFTGNWGVAIIVLTILIKLIFYPLSAASYRSMGKMKVLAPKLQRLKERYGEDRQKMHQAMMEMYKTEKVNPLGGCLPIVVQIPVFISLYWVLLLSVELRQAPFIFWIKDLSALDPYYVLPILMGITMFIQTWLNPTPPDPMQARLMKIMPVAFSVFFFFFPAGLVLYWLVNNILSIAQQWHITRALERGNAAHGKA
ncbi:MAG: membrane protein insertase YidC, partial [Betaproteobacteria bacterium]|nr:membrane protein insertase YidC [Betaproteobacteria bacterium]